MIVLPIPLPGKRRLALLSPFLHLPNQKTLPVEALIQSQTPDAYPAILHMGLQHILFLVQCVNFLREHDAVFHIFGSHEFPYLSVAFLLHRAYKLHLRLKLRNRLRQRVPEEALHRLREQ